MNGVTVLTLLVLIGLAGCTVAPPAGPSVLVLPGSGKTFEQFRYDDGICRQYAYGQIGGITPNQAATSSGVTSAVAGTAIGAAAGAAFGGGEGAAIGAGSGLLVGTLSGASAASMSGYEAQMRFDMSYIQCMYVKGNRVPISGQLTGESVPSPAPIDQLYQTPLPPEPAGQ